MLVFWNFNSGHPREPREAVDVSKMIIGHTQNINPDKGGVCRCPVCPKGNLFMNSLFLCQSWQSNLIFVSLKRTATWLKFPKVQFYMNFIWSHLLVSIRILQGLEDLHNHLCLPIIKVDIRQTHKMSFLKNSVQIFNQKSRQLDVSRWDLDSRILSDILEELLCYLGWYICETENIASEFLKNFDQKSRCLWVLSYIQTKLYIYRSNLNKTIYSQNPLQGK